MVAFGIFWINLDDAVEADYRFVDSFSLQQHATEIIMGFGIIGPQSGGAVECFDGGWCVAELNRALSEIEPGRGISGIERNRRSKRRHRIVSSPQQAEGISQIRMEYRGVGAKADRPLDQFRSVLRPA